MASWMTWSVLAGVLVIAEIFTGTFYLLMLALGFGAGALAALLGVGLAGECIAAAVVGAIATVALRRSRLGKNFGPPAANDPNMNMDIGQTVQVDQWSTPPDGVATARAMYRGAMWDIGAAPGTLPLPGQFTITEVRGNRLIVAKAS